MFVYRDEVYDPHTQQRGIAEIIIGAAREVQPCTVRVKYQGMYSLFSELDASATATPPPDLFDDNANYSAQPANPVAKVTSMAERYQNYGKHRQ